MQTTSDLLSILAKASTQALNKNKVQVLCDERSSDLVALLQAILDPQRNYYITAKQIPEPRDYPGVHFSETDEVAKLLTLLYDLNHHLRGNTAKAHIATFLYHTDTAGRALFKMAIERSCPGKIGLTIVNKALPGLIYKQPYGGVKSYDPVMIHKRFNWKSGVLLQKKMDGMTILLSRDGGGTCRCHTRQGQDVTEALLPLITRVFQPMVDSEVLHCEMELNDLKGKRIPRRKANGMFNSLFKGEDKYTIQPHQIVFTILDVINYNLFYAGKDGITAWARHVKAATIAKTYNDFTCPEDPKMAAVECQWVKSVEEAQEIVQEWISEGLEGGVLKDPDAPWEAKKMTSQMKLKNEFECTLEVVGWKPHKKHPTWVGSLLMESMPDDPAGPRISTYAGSGLNEEPGHDLDRTQGYPAFAGLCFDVKAECITNNDALQLPRIQCLRIDKSMPDTYKEVYGAYNDSISLKGGN